MANIAVLAQLVPPLVAVATGRSVRGPRLGVVTWCLVLTTADAVMGWLGSQGRNNAFVPYVFVPIAACVVLWSLAAWQQHQVARLTMRIAAPLVMVMSVVLFVLFENAEEFSRLADATAMIVLMAAALYTVVSRSMTEPDPLQRQDWFWIAAGFALYFGVNTTYGAVSAVLLAKQDYAMFDFANQVRAGIDIVAFLSIAWGMTCPTTSPWSPSFSRASSPWGSSSSPSARR